MRGETTISAYNKGEKRSGNAGGRSPLSTKKAKENKPRQAL